MRAARSPCPRTPGRACRRLVAGVLAASALMLAGAPVAGAALPSKMAALGDAISKGFGSTGVPGSGDNAAGSWVTGTDGTVNSHYARILAVNPAISGNASNFAADGKNMSAVANQQAILVTAGTEYVTIMAGTQDVCTATVAQMTTVTQFKNRLTQALNSIIASAPAAKILVVSIPNWYGLWQAFQSNPTALSAWSTYNNRCPDLLSSTATQADRDAVHQRIIDLNAGAVTVCAGFANCMTDGGAVFNLSFASTDLSYDYFSFSLTGQALLATTTWDAGFYPTPSNTALPVVSGTAQESQTLSTTNGTWTGNPTSFSYQWRRCDSNGANCVTLGGATSSTYQVQNGDVGSRLRANVTATNANGSTTASSAVTQVVAPLAPTNTVAPAISGNTVVGQTLSSTTGTWTGNPTSYGYQWLRCDSAGANCGVIDGATASSYQLTGSDAGSTIRVAVTATNAGGSASATSNQTGVVTTPPPANSTLPTISGQTKRGQTLTAEPGTWTGAPTFGYQWQRCNSAGSGCADISGETATTYVLATADVDHTIKVVVTGTNAAGSSAATSAPTAVVTAATPSNTTPPSISGTPQEGQTLSATTGAWTDNPTSFSYQWRRCNSSGGSCVDIDGATAAAYDLTSSDIGSKLRVRVTATNDDGSTAADSSATAAVTAIPPSNTAVPTVSGTAQENQTLSTTTGSWSGNNPSYSYQWQRCDSAGSNCSAISGATASTYQLGSADVGNTVRSAVTATNSGGSATAFSNVTAVVIQAAPSNTVLPTISGTAQAGQTLTASTGTWTGSPTFDYQWLRCDTNGANCTQVGTNAATYQVGTDDIGSRMRVQVTATNGGGSTSATSNPTAAVTHAPPANTALPQVTGTAQEGQTLSATTGTWTETATFAYQWRRCNSSGASCTNIGGATNSSYVISSSDIGSTLRIRVTATNDGGSASADSDATAVVTAIAPVNTALPAITGTAQEDQALSASTGTWSGNSPTYAYQWLRCDGSGANCNAISGATTSTYGLVSGDVGATIKVTVTATNSGGSASATSDPTAVVKIGAPTNTALPAIGGTAQEGQTLSASPGTWTRSPTFAYQWQRCNPTCGAISGATNSTYDVTASDIGAKLRVHVTATNDGGSATADSSQTATVIAVPPANTALPVVSGQTVENQTLSTTNGTWSGNNPSYTYQWQRCDSSGNGCAPISGATTASYQLKTADIGSTIKSAVTATNSGGSNTATSAATAVVTQAAPANTALPTITGTVQEGQTLSSTNGTWTGSPTFTYQWQRCNASGGSCSAIAGELNSTYLLTSTDVDKTIRIVVTGTNGGGSTPAQSNATVQVKIGAPTNTALPTISGIPEEGQTLTATTGTWTRNPTYAFQWQRCDENGASCANIAGATNSTYTLVTVDIDSTMRVRITATNAGGSGTASSAATPVVTALPPSNTALPTVSGQTQEGQTLTTTTGTWNGQNLTYTYQWQRCNGTCAPISGATASSYQLKAADIGSTIRSSVTATNSGGSATAQSAATATVTQAAPTNTSLPTISGATEEAQTLTATSGTWTNNPTYAYQWRRCNSSGASCTNITNATNASYDLASADIGSTIRVRVTATNDGGATAADSNATAVVTAIAPANTGVPVVSGNPVEGQTLSTTNGSWTGQSPTYSYQWQRCDSVGGNCAPISGATANTYLLASADIGHAIRAAVTATNSGGAATGTSQPTAAVTQAPPSNTSLPTVTGTPHPGQTLTGTTGSWTGSPTYAYQWQRCDTGGASCAAIAGETATTHLLTSSDVDHTIRFQVTATNGGGSVPATSNATPLVKDPPVNTALPVISGPVHESQSLSTTDGTWTGNPTSFTYRWKRCDSGGAGCVAIAGATAASYLLTATDVGRTMRAEVTATNAGGSVAATSNATAVVTAAAFVPSIQGISPTSGVPGATVTLTGSRLYKASSVKFNGVAATIRSNDASSIEVLVPAAATNGPISIVTQDGNASSTQSFTVTPPPAPSISGFSPTHGVPGTVVTVSGSKLLGATAVKFNGSPGTVTSIAATAIKVVVPAGVTTGTVSVTTSGGTVTSNPKFTADAVPVPKITSFTPSSAYVGQTVTIKGSGLIGASVAFNGAAAAITSNTASAVKAIVPAGATTGKIAVTTAGGTVLSGATFTLKASPAPKITSFTPTSAVPGTAVTIKGSGFLGATSVKFGGVEAEVTSLTATVIKVLAPPGAPVDTISVTTPGGTAFSSGVFSLL